MTKERPDPDQPTPQANDKGPSSPAAKPTSKTVQRSLPRPPTSATGSTDGPSDALDHAIDIALATGGPAWQTLGVLESMLAGTRGWAAFVGPVDAGVIDGRVVRPLRLALGLDRLSIARWTGHRSGAGPTAWKRRGRPSVAGDTEASLEPALPHKTLLAHARTRVHHTAALLTGTVLEIVVTSERDPQAGAGDGVTCRAAVLRAGPYGASKLPLLLAVAHWLAGLDRQSDDPADGSDGVDSIDRRVRSLSPELRRTLTRLLRGDSEEEAGVALGISKDAVHGHAKKIYAAFDVGTRPKLLARFLDHCRRSGSEASLAIEPDLR